MGIIKGWIVPILKLLFAFGLPAIPVFVVWIVLDPATYWQTLTTMVIGIVVYIVIGCAAVTMSAEWWCK